MTQASAIARILAACLFALGVPAALSAEPFGDLRGVVVGERAAALPAEGYKDFVCVAPAGKRVAGWTGQSECDADASGLRAMRVSYDQPGQEDTLIAGHPAILTVAFDAQARLARIVIETEPKTRLFLKKKAYLLGQQAMFRYGETGWDCVHQPLAADEEGIGTSFIKEECRKTVSGRDIVVDRGLYRKIGSEPKAFVSRSRVQISWRGP